MPSFVLTINVTVEKTEGKFVSKDELIEACVGELQEPGTLYVDDSQYEVTEWEVNTE